MTSLARRVDAVLVRSPLQSLFRWRSSRQLTVLAYHGVDDPQRFARQLDWLARSTNPIDVDHLVAGLAGRKSFPEHAVLITFDDGRRSLVERGLPLLRERRLPAAAFVVAGLVDSDRQHWWDEVKDLAARGGGTDIVSGTEGDDLVRALKRVPDETRLEAIEELRASAGPAMDPDRGESQMRSDDLRTLESGGVAVGNHTLSHPILPRCGDEKVKEEVTRAHSTLAEALGRAPRVFAYPNGDADPRAAAVLADLGYAAAFLFDHRVSRLPVPNRMSISRVRVNSHTNMDRFRVIVSGLHPALHRLRGGS